MHGLGRRSRSGPTVGSVSGTMKAKQGPAVAFGVPPGAAGGSWLLPSRHTGTGIRARTGGGRAVVPLPARRVSGGGSH